MRSLIQSKMFWNRLDKAATIDAGVKHTILVFLQYFSAVILTLCIFILLTHAWDFNLRIPFIYHGDSILGGDVTCISMLIKSIIDTGWYLKNPYIGVPGGYNLADYPFGGDNFHLLFIKILSYFTSDYALILNLFFIFTFISVTLSALCVLKRLGLRYPFALAVSLLFSFLPYHFFRGEMHLFLSSYYIIPIVVWVAVIVIPFREQNLTSKKKFVSWTMYFLLSVLIGSSGVYYMFFGIFFILLSGLITSIVYRNWSSISKSIIFTIFITGTMIINIIMPLYINNTHSGSTPYLFQRSPGEAEILGMKLTQLLLPIDNDREKILANFKQKYNSSAPQLGGYENSSPSLGTTGAIGFLILLGVLFFRKNTNDKELYTLELVSKLNLGAVLLGIIGGFGSLFAYLIDPTIRSYNRISIYIAFFSLYAFFFVVQRFIKKFVLFDNKYIYFSLSMLLLIIGIYRQTTTHSHLFWPSLPATVIKAEFNHDKNFIYQIENTLPHNSAIFQLPYIPFPENFFVNKMFDYEHFKPYLHSHYLKWSYGAMKGRPVDMWQQKVSGLPTSEMINKLIAAGFTGIYINRNGYLDNGKNIENQLTNLLDQRPLVSENNQLCFYDLRNYAAKLKKMMLMSTN